jgi:signal transduction histidine kinase
MEQPHDHHFLQDRTGPSDSEIRLQALNHTKDKLLSIVGHDLRSAIGGVISLAKMLEKRLEVGDIEGAKRLNGLIRRSSHDADDLLRDLVTWTQSHGQEIQFRLEALDLLELVETELVRLRVTASHKEQKIEVDAEGVGIIRGDRYMLQSILRNLISNALKFSYAQTTIVIRIRRLPGEWKFEICDKGIGMSAELQDMILKIDNRKQRPGTSGETGSGFGLLLCEDFIERHGGRLSWQSEPEVGTTFCFTVPELLG